MTRGQRKALELLWKGWKVIDDPRLLRYIFVSPDGSLVEVFERVHIDKLVAKELVRRVHFIGRPAKDQPGLDLTFKGLKAIGKEAAVAEQSPLVNDAPASVPAERNEGENTTTKEKTASVEALPEVE
jgi:hypothetical protein